jgi:hypothetical protein
LTALKDVSLLRCLICRRRNRTKVFYERAKYVIYKHLSVENLLFFLIEYFKLKKFLLSKSGEECFLDRNEDKLILSNEKNINKDNLNLGVLVDNLYYYKVND